MKIAFKKKIVALLLTSAVITASLFAQTSIAHSVGSASNVLFYNQYGTLQKNVNQSNLVIDKSLIIQTAAEKSVFTYKSGKFILGERSILVLIENSGKLSFYLVKGELKVNTFKSFSGNIEIITPVSEYILSDYGEIEIVSTDEMEFATVFKGNVSALNAINGKKVNLVYNKKINMSNSIAVDFGKTEALNNRSSFIEASFPFEIKPIVKSHDELSEYTLNIIATGNGQGAIEYLNYAEFSGILKEAEKNNRKYLLLDAGNTLSGSVYVNSDKGLLASQIMDKTGYDVFVPGARDFSHGVENLINLEENSSVSFVSSNVLNDEGYLQFKPYQLFLYNDLKVAVLGLSSPSLLTSIMDLDFTNSIIYDNAQYAIDEANKIADLVIVVSNYTDSSIDSKTICKTLKGIDVFIDGTSDNSSSTIIDDTYFVTTGKNNSTITDLKVSVYKNNIISIKPEKFVSSSLINGSSSFAKQMGVTSFNNDVEIEKLISMFKFDMSLSRSLIAPKSRDITYTIKDLTPTPTIVKVDSIVPPTPVLIQEPIIPPSPKFKPTVIRRQSIELPIFKKVNINKDQEVIQEIEEPIEKKAIISTTKEAESFTSHIGISTILNGSLNLENFDFDAYNYELGATLIPYFKSPSFSLGFNLNALTADLMDTDSYEYNVYPFPDANFENILAYSTSLIEYLNINSKNGSFILDLGKDKFDSPIVSSLMYGELGGDDLYLNLNINTKNSSNYLFINDCSLETYFTPVEKNQTEAGLIGTIRLGNDIFSASYGALARGNEDKVNLYPILYTKFQFVENSSLQASLNLGGSFFLPILPSADFTKILNTESTGSLFPNYLGSVSLDFMFEKLNFSFGTSYEVHEDDSKLSIYTFHKTTNRDNIFNANPTNYLSPNVLIGYNSDNFKAYVNYTLPIDMDSFEFGSDLLDTEFSFVVDRYDFGFFFTQSNLIDSVNDISTSVKDFFYNDHTEFGIHMGYNYNDILLANLALSLPSSITAPLEMNLSLTYNLDHSF